MQARKVIILLLAQFNIGCSVVIVNAPKCIHSKGNAVISGSELKDNNAKQEARPFFEIPWK